jgi:nucleoid-associated protein YgaU
MLALLGLLAGVFVAALSLRLFVPRPPRGTGPDIHMTSSTAGTAIVPPPDLSPSPAAAAPWAAPPDDATPAPSRFAAPEEPSPSPWASPTESEQPTSAPLTVLPSDEAPALAAIPSEAFPSTADETDRPLATASAATLVSNQVPAIPQTTATPWQQQPGSAFGIAVESPAAEIAVGRGDAPAFSPPSATSLPTPTIPPITLNQPYRVTEGDSWWDIAERAYGDGRLYRSLFAWNRALDPRVSLAAGTVLEIPPADRLELAWPHLMPGN